MKNVIIYNLVNKNVVGGQRADDLIVNYFKLQIENSLYYNWKKEDIVIATNFPFEYKGIKNINLTDICDWNGYNNKWYGVYELFNKYFKENCWLHDYDNWQISPINFPKFEGMISGCTYIFTEEWNSASIFLKENCISILKYIVDFLELNKNINFNGDESAIAFLRKHSEIKKYLSTIDNKYNVGLTKLEYRYNAAEKPICVLGCKLLDKNEFNYFEKKYKQLNLIPNHLQNLLLKFK